MVQRSVMGYAYIEALYAHPDDRHLLENLPDHKALKVNDYGPYRNLPSLGLMD